MRSTLLQFQCNAIKHLDFLTLIPSQSPSYLLQVPAIYIININIYIYIETYKILNI